MSRALAQTPDFGTAPSGAVPILFNDRHVYAKPDKVSRGRLLAALVHGNTLLVPLRSLFEQAGASVLYDRETRSAIVRKDGAIVEVTVGVPVVRIDGESRPLDVPPEAVGNDILVPVRVIAEALGAYVQYEPEIHAVAIRYVIAESVPLPPSTPVPLRVATPPPSAASGPRATVPPGPPIPVGTPPPETYIVADVALAPKVANAFVPARSGTTGESLAIRGATELAFFDVPLELDGEYTEYAAPHPAGAVTVLGNNGSTVVPVFTARDSELAFHLGAQLMPQKLYLAVGYAILGTNYGYPSIGGLGVGLEKLPVLSDRISYDASVFYYPNVSGACSLARCPNGSDVVSYGVLTYGVGLTYAVGPLFLDAGFRGDHLKKKSDAPVDVAHDGPYVGLGLRL
ncbi:MAG: copper amine oxidase N-terminal domain-containing protein [Candidatus Eremiobacteraeota bacterium]|nr:copper amine oxidase N-terminal domain-containing protein [Candidatus Eremiobacteraeota bacterium]